MEFRVDPELCVACLACVRVCPADAVTVEEHKDGMRMGRDPEDVVAFMLSDEMGRRLVEGKDPEAVQAGTEAALEALRPYGTPEGVVLGGAYWLVTARKA